MSSQPLPKPYYFKYKYQFIKITFNSDKKFPTTQNFYSYNFYLLREITLIFLGNGVSKIKVRKLGCKKNF